MFQYDMIRKKIYMT